MNRLRLLLLFTLIALAAGVASAAPEESAGLFESIGKLLKPDEPAAQIVDAPDPATRAVVAPANERRVALVIGNAAYKQGALTNPVNDARAMANRLRTLGFDVMLREDLKTREIGGVYREFRGKIVPGGVALVFYAGHGVQFKGQNYFPAVDSDIASEEDVPMQSLNLGMLLDNMEEAKAGVSLVFLDACRDNPFARRFRSASRGLAKVEAASGTLIHYATKPGSVASDGDGQNGTYTEALLAQISEAGVPVEQVLKRVTNRVVTKTKGKQEPWVEGSLRGDFYFIFKGPATVNVQQTPTDPEREAWDAAESVSTEAAYRAYLDAYPKGRYVTAAKIKLDAMKPPPQEVSISPASSTPNKTIAWVNGRPVLEITFLVLIQSQVEKGVTDDKKLRAAAREELIGSSRKSVGKKRHEIA
ncbi:MAG: caspase family protein [Rhodocyclaceae bacterium]|nr:caspase family protein [Rhodocyclaceae bacterium]